VSILDFLGLLLGLLSVLLAWYYGTRKKRLNDKIRKLEKKKSKLEVYNSFTGYKTMIKDSFHSFSYVGGVLLLLFGVKSFLNFFSISEQVVKVIDVFSSGIFIGCGLVLLELFLLLTKSNNSKESIQDLQSKIDNFKHRENEI